MEPIDGGAFIIEDKYTTSWHKNIRQTTRFDGFYIFGYALGDLDDLKDTNAIIYRCYLLDVYADTKMQCNGG
jgi:hypothetical protein